MPDMQILWTPAIRRQTYLTRATAMWDVFECIEMFSQPETQAPEQRHNVARRLRDQIAKIEQGRCLGS